ESRRRPGQGISRDARPLPVVRFEPLAIVTIKSPEVMIARPAEALDAHTRPMLCHLTHALAPKGVLMKKLSVVAAALAAALITAAPATADVVLQFELKRGTAPPEAITGMVRERNVRMEMPDAGGSGAEGLVIFRG